MVNQERVILIKGDRTKCYEQVIFIMNKNVPVNKMPIDFVAEAERIISGHTGGAATPVIKKTAGKRSGGFDLLLNVIMLLGCLALAGVMAYSYFA